MTTIIFLLIGFVVGLVARPLLQRHKHDYEVLWHSDLTQLCNITCIYDITTEEKESKFKLKGADVTVTYKKCKKCNDLHISFKSSWRTFRFDFDVVKQQLDKHIAKEKEKADQAL